MKRIGVVIALVVVIAALGWWRWSDSATEPTADLSASQIQIIRKPSKWTAELDARGERTLSGVVVDEQGAPVPNATVTATAIRSAGSISDVDCACGAKCAEKVLKCACDEAPAQLAALIANRTGEAEPLARAQSDAEGRFTLKGLEGGAVSLWAEAPSLIGFVAETRDGEQNVSIKLERGRMLTGRVTGPRGDGVGGAFVTAIYEKHPRFFEAVTSADGRFALGPVPARGEVLLVPAKDGMLPSLSFLGDPADIHDHSDDGLELALALYEPRTVTGLVMRDLTPVGGVTVRILDEHFDASSVSDDQGQFRFTGLRPGYFKLEARVVQEIATTDVTVIGSTDTQDVRLDLEGGVPVRGQVLDSHGRPVVGATVRAFDSDSLNVETTSGAAGAFEFSSLPLRELTFVADAPGFLQGEAEPVVTANMTVTLTLAPAGVVSGRVVDERGEPITTASVYGSNVVEDEEANDTYPREDNADASEDGTFALRRLAPGKVELRVSAAGKKEQTLTVTAPSSDVRVMLTKGATVKGVVTEADGRPIAQARVFAVQNVDGDDKEESSEVLTGADGRFELSGLVGGTHRLRASVITTERTKRMRGRGHSVRLTLAENGVADVRIVFPPSISLAGRVVDESGAGIPDVRVDVEPASFNQDAEKASTGTATTDASGAFRIEELFDDVYMLHAERRGYSYPPSKTAVKVKGGTQDVRVVLRRMPRVIGRVVDENGKPLSAFRVNHHNFVNPNGEFLVTGYGQTALKLTLGAEGLASVDVTIPPFKDTHDVGEVVLRRGRMVEGVVTNLVTGAPVDRALVRAEFEGDAPHEGLSDRQAVRTDQRGRFRLAHVDPSAVALSASSKPDFIDSRVALGPTETRVSLTMDPGATVNLSFFDAKGEPVEGNITLGKLESQDVTERRVSAPTLRLAGLTPGRWYIDFYPSSGRHFRPPLFTINGHETLNIEWREPTDGVEVKLEVAGGNVGDYRATLLQGAEHATTPLGKMNARGDWIIASQGVFKNVLPGDYTLTLQPRDVNKPGLARYVVHVTTDAKQTLSVPAPANFETLPELISSPSSP